MCMHDYNEFNYREGVKLPAVFAIATAVEPGLDKRLIYALESIIYEQSNESYFRNGHPQPDYWKQVLTMTGIGF